MASALDRELPDGECWRAAAKALGLDAYWLWVHAHFDFAAGRARRTQFWSWR